MPRAGDGGGLVVGVGPRADDRSVADASGTLERGASSGSGGGDTPAGTTLMVHNGAANRDPRQFDAPSEFRLDRTDGRMHLGFGFGIHTCVGAPLARAEARVSFERLFARTTAIAISEREHGPAGARRYEYSPIYLLRGLERLHLELTPVG